jgi:hypothetical protein
MFSNASKAIIFILALGLVWFGANTLNVSNTVAGIVFWSVAMLLVYLNGK